MNMKKRHHNPNLKLVNQPKYPNAATQQYYRQKVLDIVTAILSTAGFISAMVFLITMS